VLAPLYHKKPVAICYLPFAISSFWLLNSSF
jgi:hypothetical protein